MSIIFIMTPCFLANLFGDRMLCTGLPTHRPTSCHAIQGKLPLHFPQHSKTISFFFSLPLFCSVSLSDVLQWNWMHCKTNGDTILSLFIPSFAFCVGDLKHKCQKFDCSSENN